MKTPSSNPFVNLQKFNRRFRNSFPSVLAVCGAVALLPQVSEAANITWDGGSAVDDWSDPVNWGGDVLPAATDTVLFRDIGLPASSVISLGASQTVRKLQIDSYSAVNSFTIGSPADFSSGYTLTLTDVYRGDNNSNTQTIAASVILAADSTWNIINGFNGSVSVTGGIGSASAVTLTKEGSNTLAMSGVNTFTGSLRVLGGGLTLSKSNAYAGTTTLSGGSLNVSFETSTSTNTINSLSALVLGGIRGGGTLTVTGKNVASSINSQTFGGLTLNPAASTLNIVNGIATGKTLVALGGITRNSGSTINFVQPTVFTTISAQNGYTTSTSNDASGILGAYSTVAGTNWATNDGTNIVAYTGHTVLAGATPTIMDGATTNVLIDNTSTDAVGQAAGTVTVNTLNANDTAARSVTVGSGNTLRLGAIGGILSTGSGGLTVGASGNAGTLTAGGTANTAGELILNNTTALVVNSVVADNGLGGIALTKSGGGTATLAASNTYTGTTTLNAGILAFAPNSIMSSATTSGSATVTASTAGLLVGQTVSGSGIPAFTRIASIVNGTQYTLSQNATVTNATANLVYYTGNTTSLSSTTTDPKIVTVDTTGLAVGQTVTGSGIPTTTKIASITNATTLVLDKAATASGTVDLTYNGGTILSSTTTDGKSVTVASTAGLVVGQTVTGTGIPAYSTVVSITDGTTFVISSAATAAATVNLAYSNNALSTAGNITFNGGTLELGSAASVQTTSGTVIMAGGSLSNGMITKSGANFDVRAGTINTKLAGSVGLDKTTAGTLTFANTVSNTFTGDTTITEGTVVGPANGSIAISGNLIVGSAGGSGTGASYFNNGSNVNFNRAKNVTVYSNGSVNFGGGAQNLDTGVSILGGYLYGGQIYQNTTINMTGGTFAGGAYGTSNSFNTSASASTAFITASLLNAATKNFTVADGDAATDLLLSGGIATNPASIAKGGAGKMVISSVNNANTGSTTINGGTLSVAKLADGAASSSIGASAATAANLKLGNGTTLQYTGSGHSTNRLFTINGTAAGHSATLDASGTGAVNFTGTGSLAYGTGSQSRTLILAGTSTADNTLAAAIEDNGSGAVSVTKIDAGKWILSGTIAYTGDTVVNGGILSVAAATLSDTSAVDIANSAFLNLTHAFTNTVDSFYINGVQQAAGVWGAIGSGAAHETARITGTGKLDVINGAVVSDPFVAWIDTFTGLTNPADKAKAADPDKDGVNNLAEFALKGNPDDGSDNGLAAALLQDTIAPATKELTYIIAVRDGATFAAGAGGIQTATVVADSVTYTVQGSLNLVFPGSAVSHVSVSNTAPVATGLPDLTGTSWEYHTFRLDASEGTIGKGFLRAMVTEP